MSYTVCFALEAINQLAELEDFIASSGTPTIAARYIDAILDYCQNLATFPERGLARDDVMLGLRVTNYSGNTIIAFLVDSDTEMVSIVGVFYDGRDYAALLQDDH